MIRRGSKSHEIEGGAEFPARLPLPGSGSGVAFSFDSQRLYAVDSSAVFSFARGTGERAPFARVGAHAGVIAASPTEPVVACATAAAAFVFDAAGKLLRKTPLSKGVGATNAVAFSPNGAVFAVGTGHLNSKVTTLEIFASSGQHLRAIKDDVGYGITEICFTGDSKHVITIRDDPEDTRGAYFERWPVAGGRPHRVRVGSLFGADSLASAKGLVATCSRHGGGREHERMGEGRKLRRFARGPARADQAPVVERAMDSHRFERQRPLLLRRHGPHPEREGRPGHPLLP